MYLTINNLLTSLGFPLFVPYKDLDEIKESNEVFYMNNRESNGSAHYSSEGMTVLKGYKIADGPTKSFSYKNLLEQLQESEVINDQGVFTKDYTFTTPSAAGSIISLSFINGWAY